MKLITNLSLAAFLVLAGSAFAEEQRVKCNCEDCQCTPDNHCGCLSEKGCNCGNGRRCGCGGKACPQK